jgi:hypothetical protein
MAYIFDMSIMKRGEDINSMMEAEIACRTEFRCENSGLVTRKFSQLMQSLVFITVNLESTIK